MKNIYILSCLLLVAACRKEQSAAQGQKTYHCLCETKTTYVDHCGRDSSLASLNVSGSDENEAQKECSSNDLSAGNSYSVTSRTCELK